MQRNEIIEVINQKTLEAKKIINEINDLKKLLSNYDNQHKTNFTNEEKINIFMDYFKGRDSIYPYLSIDKKDPSKKYYIPKCANEWNKNVCNKTMGKKCKDCQYWVDKPIDKEVIRNHLFNSNPIGIYPMLEDETCYFLAFDFDDKKNENDIKEDVLAFAGICDKYNVPISIERSRSGHGIHVWIFFENNIKALTARKMGSLLLSKTMEIRDNLKIDSFDRMFPNQDTMPKGGYGNLIALPFQNEPMKYNNTAFLDRNFIAYDDQYNYLSKVKKMSYDEVFSVIRILSENTIDISNEYVELKKEIKNKQKNNFDFPKNIDVTLDNMVYIDKANLSAAVKNCFRRLATFANPEFFKKQRMRMSVHNIPMVIDCSKEDDKYLMIPRGKFEYLCDLCNQNNIKMNIIDRRNEGQKLNIKFNGKLREEQRLALKEMLKYENGILEAPTGFGKTVICCKLIEEKNVNTLIVTFNLSLLNQWKERLKEFLNIEEVGQIGDNKNTLTNTIDVASIKTIYNDGKFSDIVKNYGMIIIDECHHSSAYTYEAALNMMNAKYVYGVSATPEKENGHTPIIKMQCGDIRYKVDMKEYNKKLNLSMKVYSKSVHLNFVNKNVMDYKINEIYDLISKDVIRNEVVIKDVEKEYKNGKNVLVLTERIDHLEYLYEKLLKVTNNIIVYRGGLGKKVLKKYDELNTTIKEKNENKIIIATSSCIGEGFDDSTLEVLFLTMPISSVNRIVQYTGRLHRKNEKKKEIIVYDYVDDNFSMIRNMFLKRKKAYEKVGYEIIEDNYQMTI